VTKIKTTLIIVVAVLLFAGSLYLYVANREELLDEDVVVGERVYRNETLGYEMNYPITWEIEEKRAHQTFFPETTGERLPQTSIDLEAYRQIFGLDLIGTSPLTYIDGVISYNIEKAVYSNENNFSARQWYDIAVLLEAYNIQKISEADFIRMSNKAIEEGFVAEKDKIFDPWMPEGEVLKVGRKEILRTTRFGDTRYAGYQYYITTFDDYVFVFYFGYGGPVIPREMWQRSDMHVKGIIWSLKKI
jgi:hypothetical protein